MSRVVRVLSVIAALGLLGLVGTMNGARADAPKSPSRQPAPPTVTALPAAKGQSCENNRPCATGLSCTADTKKCMAPGDRCTVTGKRGECAKGQYAVRNQQLVCSGPAPRAEICNNNLDEDCDGLLNTGCPALVLVDNYKVHCGMGGKGSHIIGGRCPSGYAKGTCEVKAGPQVRGELSGSAKWKDANLGSGDCTCEVSCWSSSHAFKGGDWFFRVTAKPCSSPSDSSHCMNMHRGVPGAL
jgi:hypothetical protein